jgi:hypothetical protein
MAGLSTKEYNNLVDENLVLFGSEAPCCNIDPRLWDDFKIAYKEKWQRVPKTIDWSFDQVTLWLKEEAQAELDLGR